MSIASGALHLAQTGLLHRRAAAPPCLVPALRHRFPGTEWQGARWTNCGRVWSSCSAVDALDMTAAWMRQYFWDRGEAVQCALAAAGVSGFEGDW